MPQARGTGTAIAAAQLGTWVNSGSWFGPRDPMGLAKYSWVKVCHFAVRPPVLTAACVTDKRDLSVTQACGRPREHTDHPVLVDRQRRELAWRGLGQKL